MSETPTIGTYEILDCTLKKWNGTNPRSIGNLVMNISIEESIYDQAVSGSFTVLDAVGLLEGYPIIGEEIIELKYKDCLNNEKSGIYHIHSVENNVFDHAGQKQVYILNFASLDYIKSEASDIKKSYKGKIHDSVQDVFDEYFDTGKKELDKEETTNEATIVVPGMSAFGTMNLFAKKSFSSENKSSNFVFFENRDKYHFKTYEQLMKDGRQNLSANKIFEYRDPRTEANSLVENTMQTIQDFKIDSRLNIISEIRNGGMLSEAILLDLATKTYEEVPYEHKDEFNEFVHSDPSAKTYHSNEFIEEFFNVENNKVQNYIIFDDSTRESTQNDETKYVDIISRRGSSNYYQKQLTATASIYGRNDVVVGDVISVNLPSFKLDSEEINLNENISGFWLVEEITHLMTENQWMMHLTLTKDSYKQEYGGLL